MSESNFKTPCIAVIPVGPNVNMAFLQDTIESCLHFLDPSSKIALLNDSGKDIELPDIDKNRIIIDKTPFKSKGYTTRGTFWEKLATYYDYLSKNYDFEQILRLDDDSLVTGPCPEWQAAERFATDPKMGLLGQFRNMPDGTAVSNAWPAERTELELSSRFFLEGKIRGKLLGFFPRIKCQKALRRQVDMALQNNWVIGENVTGGGYFVKTDCIKEIHAKGNLICPDLNETMLCDDHLLSLAVAASGWFISDFAGPEDPIAYRLDRLPMPIPEILASKKKIIHSVRRLDDLTEGDIRKEFAKHRA